MAGTHMSRRKFWISIQYGRKESRASELPFIRIMNSCSITSAGDIVLMMSHDNDSNFPEKEMRTFFIFFLAAVVGYAAKGQQFKTYDLASLARQQKIEVFNRTMEPFSEAGRTGVHLSEASLDGIAWLTGESFSNGVIELDIKGRDLLQRSFAGIAFHGAENRQFDAVYFRPFNFRASDSVRKIHAVQYTSHPSYDWKLLRDSLNGQFESAVNPPPEPDAWFHVRIEVYYPSVKVFVNGNSKPCLQIKQLSNRRSGKIGLLVGDHSDGYFSNLRIQPAGS